MERWRFGGEWWNLCDELNVRIGGHHDRGGFGSCGVRVFYGGETEQ